MDIGLVYSQNDPRQTEARDFVREFIRKHGVMATIMESKENVASPTVIIDGWTLKDRRMSPRAADEPMFPGIIDIAAALEQHFWNL